MMYSLALAMSWGGSPCNNVLRTFPTIWCILSHRALDWGFLAVVHTSLMWQFCHSVWNFGPVNSPPGSCIQHCGHGKRVSQHCTNFCMMWSEFFFSILTSSTRLVTVSITVRASNLQGLPWTWTVHGPIRSTVHSSNRIERTYHSGKNPCLLPSNLFIWQKL
jgi:hypothetical protein